MYNEVFRGDQPCQCGISAGRFRDRLCLHQGLPQLTAEDWTPLTPLSILNSAHCVFCDAMDGAAGSV
jgi:hypothetical protein